MLNVVISRGLANIAGNHHANLYAARKGKNGRALVVDVMGNIGGLHIHECVSAPNIGKIM